MKRRQFFKTIGMGLGGVVTSLLPAQEAEPSPDKVSYRLGGVEVEPVILGVDVAVLGPSTVSYRQGFVTENLGGYHATRV